jgi:hypothetical protein
LILAACQDAAPAAPGEEEPAATAVQDDEEQEASAPEEEDAAPPPTAAEEDPGAEEQGPAEAETQEEEPAEAQDEDPPSQDETQSDEPPPQPETENGDPPELPSAALTEEELDLLFDPDPCLWDTWIADNDSYLSFYNDLAIIEGAEPGSFTAVEGTMALTLSESWQWTLESDLIVTIRDSLSSNIRHSGSGIYGVYDGQFLAGGATETTAAFAGRSDSVTASGEEWVGYTCDEESLMLGALLYHREQP